MSDTPQPQTYELAVSAAINKDRAAAVRFTRYNPWVLGIYVTASLFVPLAAAVIGFLLFGLVGCLALVLFLPVPIFVILWAIDAALVERSRLRAERAQLQRAGGEHVVQQLAPPAAAMVATRKHLRLGVLVNNVMRTPAAPPDPAMVHLKLACLQLVKLGSDGENWSRSALAEGPNKRMAPEDWDLASPELQELGLFEVKAGKGGGLRPASGRSVVETIARLEAAL